MKRKLLLVIVAAAASAMVSEVVAAPVTGWIVVDPQNGATVSGRLFDGSTSSPILGNGSANHADQLAMYADISGVRDGAADISLANGESITLSGFATLSGITASHEQFRFGLFQESTAIFDAINWTGFMASNSSNATGGALRTKEAGDGTTFAQTGDAINLQTAKDGDEFTDETYHFSLKVSRFNDEVSVDASLMNGDGWSQVWKNAVSFAPLPMTFDFNRVGFLSGGGMNADQIAFSSIDVTKAPIEALTLEIFTAGPDAGTMRIRNHAAQSFEVEYYEIRVASGALDAGDWTSLDAQEGNDDEFEGWEEATGSGALLLSEYRLLSTIDVNTSALLSLGKAFVVGADEDVEFWVGLADGTLARGIVEYVADGLTGDFNRDGAVDAADYVAWRKGPGVGYISDDYQLWRSAFGNMTGAGGNYTTVPEGSAFAVVSILIGHFVVQSARGRRVLRHI